jgi:hypothetical protein
MLTSLIVAVLTLAIAGFLCWLIIKFIPMPAPFPQVIAAVVVFGVIIWLLYWFGIGDFDWSSMHAHHHR